jgi:16S rRNA (uracil1498-N3)-methyltransferase
MSIPYFYEPSIQADKAQFVLGEISSKHCVQVLRMKTGDALKLTDGKGSLYFANLLSEDRKQAVVQIHQVTKSAAPICSLSIGIAMLKNSDRYEWMLEKVTELGVTNIYPLTSKRTEQQRFRLDRYQQILVAAMLQSEQTWLPKLHQPQDVIELIKLADNQEKIIAHCEDDRKTSILQLAITTDSLILIGPEGDFTKDEIAEALSHQFLPVTLGNTRLRTETAGIVAIALLANRN